MKSYVPVIAVIALGTAGCASVPSDGLRDPKFQIKFTDNPVEKAFEVTIQSLDAKKMCLTIEQWPRGGQVYTVGTASLTTSNGVVPADVKDFGYCPGGCGTIEIAPHGSLKAKISYSAFGDSVTIANDSKRDLSFLVQPFYCRK